MNRLKQLIKHFEKFEELGFSVSEETLKGYRFGLDQPFIEELIIAKKDFGKNITLHYRYNLKNNQSEFLIIFYSNKDLNHIENIFQFIPFCMRSRSFRISEIEPTLILKSLLPFLKNWDEDKDIKKFRQLFIHFYRNHLIDKNNLRGNDYLLF